MNGILKIREECLKQYGVDLASTDNSRKIVVAKALEGRFNPSFKRNGVDGILDGIETELKTTKINSESVAAAFQFHVMGDIVHNRYLFVVMDTFLNVLRSYDVANPASVEAVNCFLKEAKSDYLMKHRGVVQKRDIIDIPESFIKEVINAEK